MKIYTFLKPLYSFSEDVLSWTRRSWESQGFDLVIARESDALDHPLAEQLAAVVSKFPNINDRSYSHYAYIRWLALYKVMEDSAGWIIDYDLYNNGANWLPIFGVSCSIYKMGAIYFYREDIVRFVHAVLSYPSWLQFLHVSDMLIARDYFKLPTFDTGMVAEYPNISAPLIHFGGAHNKLKLIEFASAKASTEPAL